jgi:hypothetical protein
MRRLSGKSLVEVKGRSYTNGWAEIVMEMVCQWKK